tara:strand:+ start:436 stop:813 length:378 start_codon:yes stop_codon:yes gene_type:complete
VQAVNGVPVKSSAEATRRIQQAAPGVLQLLIMPAGVRERIKADAKLRSGAQTPEASPKPVKERVPLTRRLSFSRRRSSSKGVAKDADDATGGDAASKVIKPVFAICDTPCHPPFSYITANSFFVF